ncbi:UNVERIFIED_CONTAM: hypothetical protein Sradi_6241900 [Sesamum radiatum]|uniref:Uncharacterized protein n=1 Tax=Sesamum radiatum TaxID=300843 RepID=A0AAW2KBD5_SESRA
MLINFRNKLGDFNAKLTHQKIQDRRKFSKALLSFRQQGLIDSDNFYEKSDVEIKNLKEALQEKKSLDISEESKLLLRTSRDLSREISMRTLWHGEIGTKSKQL